MFNLTEKLTCDLCSFKSRTGPDQFNFKSSLATWIILKYSSILLDVEYTHIALKKFVMKEKNLDKCFMKIRYSF